MTLQEWYDHLNRHDWTFQYSDDHKYWLKGKASLDIIHNTLDFCEDPQYRDLYDRFIVFINDVEGDIEKPKRPEERTWSPEYEDQEPNPYHGTYSVE